MLKGGAMDHPESYPQALAPALHKCRAIADELHACERRMEELKIQLRDAWKEVPHMKVRQFHECCVCHRPTAEKFGERSMCRKHVGVGAGKGDPAMVAILEKLIYGKTSDGT